MLVNLIRYPYHTRRISLWEMLISIALTCCTPSTPSYPHPCLACFPLLRTTRTQREIPVTNRLIQRIKDLVYSFCVFETRNATVISSQWRNTRCPKRITVLALPASSFMDASISLSLSLWLYSPFNLGRFFSLVGRTPWTGDQPVARPLHTHRTTQTQNESTQISMPRVGFEPTIPAFARAKTVHVLYRVATVIGHFCL
jgi:hypothetical protein